MYSATVEEVFPAPATRVWEVLCDVERYPSRIESYVRVELEGEGGVGPGARWEQTRVVFGREHAQVMQVHAWEPPRLWTLVAREGGAEYETRYELAEVEGGTRVRVTFTARPMGLLAGLFMRVLGARMVASTGEAMGRDLAELAAVCA